MPLDQTHIVLGFTGPIGSGCSYISRSISEMHNYKYYKLSDIIRDHLETDNKDIKDIDLLQDKGNELRETRGPSYLVEETFNKIEKEVKSGEDIKGVIIDGIKNEAEVQALRLARNFFLFSVHADKELRSKRLILNGTFRVENEFQKADTRDELEESSHGQQVKKCDYLSDIIFLNNEDIPTENRERKTKLISDIYWDYIDPIESYAQGKTTIPITPSTDELCMTIAYSFSKMSSCLKRKVGAVIIEEIESEKENEEKDKERNVSMPVLVSSGYNDVPLGLPKCLYHPEYQRCYRDFLQEKHADGFRFCPSCGKEIQLRLSCRNCGKVYEKYVNRCSQCKIELNPKYQCECGIKVFDVFTPGGKNSPGKLLDMCRALHAEEMALLNLIKNNVATNGLTLYTTTQPCNLCANKIVNAGIKRVVFSEPYTAKESEEVLRKGGVDVKRFQGIKSNAFFRLYR